MLKQLINIISAVVNIAKRINSIRRQKKDEKETEDIAELLDDSNKPNDK